MQDRELFGMALGIVEPWFVEDVSLKLETKELDIHIDFRRGGVFACPECGAAGCKAYDTSERSWRHLDFFQFRTTLRARVPRVTCGSCGLRPAKVPWAREGSGFTLLFEAFVTGMAVHMAIAPLARQLGETDTRIWRLLERRVAAARKERDDSAVTRVAMDETACQRGHRYISLFADVDQRRVLFVASGSDANTVAEFAKDLRAHGGNPEAVTDVCCDMSAAFVKGVEASLPNAAITFDKFHIAKLLGDAVDRTRRQERREHDELRGHRYLFLRDPSTMSDAQLETGALFLSKRSSLKTVRAFHLKLAFTDFYAQPRKSAAAFLRAWCAWAQRSRVPEMVRAQRTIRRHWDGVLAWFTSRITNGMLEAINGLVQTAKARARGFRSLEYLKTITYLIAGRLDLQLTH